MDDDLLEAIQDVEIRSGAAACVLLSGAAATVVERRAPHSGGNAVQRRSGLRVEVSTCSLHPNRQTRLHVDVVLPVILEDCGEF